MLLPIVDYDGAVSELNLDESQPVAQDICVPAHPRSQKQEEYVLQRMQQQVDKTRMAMAFFYLHKSLLASDKKEHVGALLHQLSPWLFTYGSREGQKVKSIVNGQDSEILVPQKKLVLP